MPRVSVRNSVRKPIRPRAGTTTSMPHPAGAVVDERLRPALAQREELGDDAEVLLGHVDRDALDRLVHLAVDDPRHDLRLADGELEALAPHLLDQHRELQLAAALHLPGVRPLGREHAQRDVADELGLRAGSRPAAPSALSPSRPASGEVLMPTRHRERRLVDARSRAAAAGRAGRRASRRSSPRGCRRRRSCRPARPRRPRRGRAPRSRTARSPSRARSSRRRGTRRPAAPRRIVPCCTRQSASRPTYGEASRLVTSACSGWPSS